MKGGDGARGAGLEVSCPNVRRTGLIRDIDHRCRVGANCGRAVHSVIVGDALKAAAGFGVTLVKRYAPNIHGDAHAAEHDAAIGGDGTGLVSAVSTGKLAGSSGSLPTRGIERQLPKVEVQLASGGQPYPSLCPSPRRGAGCRAPPLLHSLRPG